MPAAYSKIEREDLTTSVTRRLRTPILDGTLRPNDRLPPERTLAIDLGVDRNTVRSAIQELERLGLVERRQGSGSRVLDYRETGSLDLLRYLVVRAGTEEVDVTVLRSVIDILLVTVRGIAHLIVRRAEAADFSAIRGALAELDAAAAEGSPDAIDKRERRLVRLEFRAAHSIAAELTLNMLDQLVDTLFAADETPVSIERGRIDAARLSLHRDVVDALEQRDEARAERLAGLLMRQISDDVVSAERGLPS